MTESRRRSLAEQRQCVEHLIALAEKTANPDVVAGARAAALTLAWFERRAELTRALADLAKRAPHLAAFFEMFPGATIADVRETAPVDDENDLEGKFYDNVA